MAKSIRSKQRRKMRNIKREKYAKKDLEKLKGIVALRDAEMKELYTVKSAADVKKDSEIKTQEDESMDTAKPKAKVNKTTLKTKHGNYPVWISPRKQKKIKKQSKKKTKGKK